MTTAIENQLPGTWQELETVVGRVLTECGYDVDVQKNVKLARGDVDVDVRADDPSSPHEARPARGRIERAGGTDPRHGRSEANPLRILGRGRRGGT